MKDKPSHSTLQRLLARLKRLFGRKPEPEPEPEDPFAGVRSPNKRGPQNRSGAVALAEPDEDDEEQSFPRRTG
jgi:hypothetical protein